MSFMTKLESCVRNLFDMREEMSQHDLDETLLTKVDTVLEHCFQLFDEPVLVYSLVKTVCTKEYMSVTKTIDVGDPYGYAMEPVHLPLPILEEPVEDVMEPVEDDVELIRLDMEPVEDEEQVVTESSEEESEYNEDCPMEKEDEEEEEGALERAPTVLAPDPELDQIDFSEMSVLDKNYRKAYDREVVRKLLPTRAKRTRRPVTTFVPGLGSDEDGELLAASSYDDACLKEFRSNWNNNNEWYRRQFDNVIDAIKKHMGHQNTKQQEAIALLERIRSADIHSGMSAMTTKCCFCHVQKSCTYLVKDNLYGRTAYAGRNCGRLALTIKEFFNALYDTSVPMEELDKMMKAVTDAQEHKKLKA